MIPLTVWTLAFFAGVGTATAAPMEAVVGAAIPLVLCDMPILGSVSAWSLELIREGAIWFGALSMIGAVFFIPADWHISPTRVFLGGFALFAFGVAWVTIITYAGTEILDAGSGSQALINAATCGLDTSG